MSAWAVVRREWSEWRLLVIAALVLGGFAWAAPFFPGLDRLDPADAREGMAALVLLLLGVASIAFLGSSLARDLVSGRVSFYLARPVGGAALWTGKMLGAASLLLCIGTLAVLPTLVAEPELHFLSGALDERDSLDAAVPLLGIQEFFVVDGAGAPKILPLPLFVLGLLLALVAALMLVHWAYLAIRSRSKWLWLDAAGVSVAGALSWWQWDALMSEQAYGGLVWIERGWTVWLPLVLWWAGREHLDKGRIDPVSCHRTFSRILWSGVALGLAVAGAFTGHVLSESVDDLSDIFAVSTSPDGEHLLVGGPLAGRAGRQGAFLLDVSGDEVRSTYAGGLFPTLDLWRWSADGRVAVWSRCRRLVPFDCELWTWNRTASPRPTGIPVVHPETVIALSPEGRRVALGSSKKLEVYDLENARLVFGKNAESASGLRFLDEHRLRAYAFLPEDETRREIREVDLRSGGSTVTGELPGDAWGRSYPHSPDGRRMFVDLLFPGRCDIRDAATGEVLTNVGEPLQLEAGFGPVDGRFLPDGRLLLIFVRLQEGPVDADPRDGSPTTRDYEIRVLEEDGTVSSEISIPRARQVRIASPLDGHTPTLVVHRPGPKTHKADPRLAAAGLEPLAGVETYFLPPGEDRLVLAAEGFAPLGLGPHYRRPLPSRSFVFVAGDEALFTFEGDDWKDGPIRVLLPPRPDAVGFGISPLFL